MRIARVNYRQFQELWSKLQPQQRYVVDTLPCTHVLLKSLGILVVVDVEDIEVPSQITMATLFEASPKDREPIKEEV